LEKFPSEASAAENGFFVKPGFSCQPLHKTTEISETREIDLTVYLKFSELFGVPVLG
jgi:hypothetical protein